MFLINVIPNACRALESQSNGFIYLFYIIRDEMLSFSSHASNQIKTFFFSFRFFLNKIKGIKWSFESATKCPHLKPKTHFFNYFTSHSHHFYSKKPLKNTTPTCHVTNHTSALFNILYLKYDFDLIFILIIHVFLKI